mgnify:CR=1 FL=1
MSQKGKLELRTLKPLNEKQAEVLETKKNSVLCGAAGTGKTLLLLYKAMKAVERREVDRVLIVRSTVSSRDVGFLPGSLEDKTKVYEQPYEDMFTMLYDNKDAYRQLKRKWSLVDFKPTSFMRGNIGFEQFTHILREMPDDFQVTEFGVEDIVRSGLVKRYLTTKHQLGY